MLDAALSAPRRAATGWSRLAQSNPAVGVVAGQQQRAESVGLPSARRGDLLTRALPQPCVVVDGDAVLPDDARDADVLLDDRQNLRLAEAVADDLRLRQPLAVRRQHLDGGTDARAFEQAREIGMMRVTVIAEAGYEKGAKEIAKRRHVRLIDRSSMEAELSELQLPMAAKIIAVARARSAAEPSAA